MIEKEILILKTGVAPHGGIVGCKDGRLPEFEKGRYELVL